MEGGVGLRNHRSDAKGLRHSKARWYANRGGQNQRVYTDIGDGVGVGDGVVLQGCAISNNALATGQRRSPLGDGNFGQGSTFVGVPAQGIEGLLVGIVEGEGARFAVIGGSVKPPSRGMIPCPHVNDAQCLGVCRFIGVVNNRNEAAIGVWPRQAVFDGVDIEQDIVTTGGAIVIGWVNLPIGASPDELDEVALGEHGRIRLVVHPIIEHITGVVGK